MIGGKINDDLFKRTKKIESQKVIVKTEFCKDLIRQEVSIIGNDMVTRLVQQIIQLQDEGISQALIKLGWTPPKHKG